MLRLAGVQMTIGVAWLTKRFGSNMGVWKRGEKPGETGVQLLFDWRMDIILNVLDTSKD